MSWSHSKTGTPAAIIESLSSPRGITCVEPENTFKGKALELIETVLTSYPETQEAVLSAYGSQSTDAQGGVMNSLSISISAKQPS